MKKILLTLAKWFHVDLTEKVYVEVEKVVKVPEERIVEKQVALEGTVEGDVLVTGDLVVTGKLEVMGGICSCLGVCGEVKQTRARNAKGQFIKKED